MTEPVVYQACSENVIWADFETISAVFDKHSGATHIVIPDQRFIFEYAAKAPLSQSTLLDQLMEEFDCQADGDANIRDTLSVRLDELIALGLLRPVST